MCALDDVCQTLNKIPKATKEMKRTWNPAVTAPIAAVSVSEIALLL